MSLFAVLLAAGQSRRFGVADKLLAPLEGRPLVRWSADTLRTVPANGFAAVVSSGRVAALLPPGFQIAHIAPGRDMALSFQLALRLARDAGASRVLIALGDMPLVPPEHLARLAQRTESAASRVHERRLPPVLIAALDFDRASAVARGDGGARDFIRGLAEDACVVMDPDAARDVDEEQDIVRLTTILSRS